MRAEAEKRLTDAAAAHGLADPRPSYRERLRVLRESHRDAFDRAVVHYEGTVLPALAGGDPLRVWGEYGSFLGGLTAAGALVSIDASGRSADYPGTPGDLVLYIPEPTAEPVLVVAQPLNPTAAQAATLDLLVNRKLVLG